jgi:competence protein ComEC
MSSESKLTVIPSTARIVTGEWLLIMMAVAATVCVWIYFGHSTLNSSSASAQSGITYQKNPPRDELEVTFLDVGEGDCAFIRTPNGHTALIDAGPGRGKYSQFDAGLQVIIPFFKSRGITRIDSMVMTHPHADHYGGMIPVMKAVEIGEFLDPGLSFPSRGYEDLLLEVQRRKIPYKMTHAPLTLNWDPSIMVQVLWPEPGPSLPGDPNNNSIVIRLVYLDVVYLFTGDIEIPVERELYAYGKQLRTTVLKIPHHGSNTSSTRAFLDLLNPRLAVFSLGYNNRFDHPDQEVVHRYEDMDIRTLRTDRAGTVRTLCNGRRVRVMPEYGTPFSVYPFPSSTGETE